MSISLFSLDDCHLKCTWMSKCTFIFSLEKKQISGTITTVQDERQWWAAVTHCHLHRLFLHPNTRYDNEYGHSIYFGMSIKTYQNSPIKSNKNVAQKKCVGIGKKIKNDTHWIRKQNLQKREKLEQLTKDIPKITKGLICIKMTLILYGKLLTILLPKLIMCTLALLGPNSNTQTFSVHLLLNKKTQFF